jgi:uncharacterized protein (DUF488 family)
VDHPPLYTIGYGARELADFLALLARYGIEYLIDVRSSPYSGYKPEYSREPLENQLRRAGIRYVFMGDVIGGLPGDEEAEREDGKVDYEEIARSPRFREGLERLRTAWEKRLRVTLMCSEQKPHECHRTRLIGVALSEMGIDLTHIDETGEPITQREVILSITGPQGDFLGLPPELIASRKRHRKKSEP